MSKRKYTHIQLLEEEILTQREAGKTYREIAEHYNLEKEQVRELLKRCRRRQAKMAEGKQPCPEGRRRKRWTAATPERKNRIGTAAEFSAIHRKDVSKEQNTIIRPYKDHLHKLNFTHHANAICPASYSAFSMSA